MSYIQIEIGGKLRGLKFNELAVRKYSEIVMQDVANGLTNETDIATNGIFGMFWGGLVGNCYVKRETIDFTFEDVCDWVEALPNEVIKQVSDVFIECNKFKELLENVKGANADIKKKKAQKQKQK
jgi:hypothetical protein